MLNDLILSADASPGVALQARSYVKVEPQAFSPTSSTSSTSLAVAGVRTRLESAVNSHLIADVPVGVFLSSGLDSTAIAALAAKAHPGIHTFTVAFPDLEFSEAAEARTTAKRLGTQHSELELSGDEMLARLDEAISAFDQPSMDGINTYFVSWAARQSGLKVALSGLGSDEIFGGYPTFRTTQTVARLARVAHFVPDPLRRFAASIASAGDHSPAREKALAAWLTPDAFPHPYFFTRALFTPQQLATQAGPLGGRTFRSDIPAAHKKGASAPEVHFGPFASATPSSAPGAAQSWPTWLSYTAAQARSMDAFTAVSSLELRSYMLNTLLRDTDAMSMANSLEVRVPFLDPPLVESVLSLPESQKRGSRPKSLLIEALGDLLPPSVASQTGARKRTFTFPWENWLRGPLKARVTAGMNDWSPALAPVLNRDFALRVWEQFQQGRTTWSRPWSLYVLNEWAKRHLQSAERNATASRGDFAEIAS